MTGPGRNWKAAATPLAAAVAFAIAVPAQATETIPTKKVELAVDTVVSGIDQGWAVEVLPDGAYLLTERTGSLRVVRDGKRGPAISGLPDVFVGGQGGLLDVALDPAFADNRKIYFTASIRGSGGQGTALFGARLSQDESALSDVERLFVMNRFSAKSQHFGSRISVAPDGSLFFGIGDRGAMDRAQDPLDHAGSILHINADGSIPSDNPHPQGGEWLPEIWSIGHRNPQGVVIDPEDGLLYAVEHGARGGDEINQPQVGRNYGWPRISFGRHYSGAEIGMGQAAEGYEQPLYYWDPSIAPGAIEIYRGAMFPEWEGDFLVAALKYQLIARLERDESGAVVHEERLFAGDYGRLRDVKVAPDGSILVLTDGPDGRLLKVTRAPDS